jgi:HAD superfamily hydrolase (TIGR01509 family)
MGEPGLVIFDNDGVLVDSEVLGNKVMAETLTACGYPITWEETVRRFLGGTLTGVRQTVEAELGRPLPGFEDRYQEALYGEIRRSLQAVPGVEKVVRGLVEAGTPICVASSGRHAKIRVALTTVGLWHHFEGRVFSSEDVVNPKPAPDLFLHAANRCGVPPGRCVVVEDSPTGVAAAKAAGMIVVGHVGLTSASALADAGADPVVGSMDELPEVLAALGVPIVP